MIKVDFDFKTHSISQAGKNQIWQPTAEEKWSQFRSILNSKTPGAIRVLLKSDEFIEISDSLEYEDITSQLDELHPASTDITSWSSFGEYQLVVYANDTVYWTYNDNNRRTDQQTIAFRGIECKASILDIEGIGTEAIAMTLVTYGNLWTLRKIKFGDPIEAWRDTQWMTTREFLGCPRNICFDGLIDAALIDAYNGYLVLYIGQYLVEIRKDKSPKPPSKPGYSVIAASDFTIDGKNNDLYITSTGNAIFIDHDGHRTVRNIQEWFPDIKPSDTIDAAFAVENQLTLIVGNQSNTRTIDISIQNEPVKFENISNTTKNYLQWPGVFADIDAAYQRDGKIFFIRRNFYVSFNITGGRATELRLIQRNLFNCPDDEYNKPILGITNFTDFVKYQNQFKPSTVPLEEPSPPPTTKPSKAIIAIIILVVILLVVVILIAIVYWRKRMNDSDNVLINQETSISTIVTIDSNINNVTTTENLDHHLLQQDLPTTSTDNTMNTMKPMSVGSNN